MKISFVYSSLSGNTKRLAYGLHELWEMSSTITSVDAYKEIESDIYVLCSWIDKAKPDQKSLEMVEAFHDKKVYLIATLGASPESEHGKDCIKNMKELYGKSHVIGVDLVQGSVSDQVIDMFKKLPEDHPHALTKEKLRRYEAIKGRPDSEDIENAYNKMKKYIETVTV